MSGACTKTVVNSYYTETAERHGGEGEGCASHGGEGEGCTDQFRSVCVFVDGGSGTLSFENTTHRRGASPLSNGARAFSETTLQYIAGILSCS